MDKMPPVVLCLGMKRSGSTLQFNIARQSLTKRYVVKNLGFLETAGKWQLLKEAALDEKRTAAVVAKAHTAEMADIEQVIDLGTKVIHIYRDLRDVYLSCKEKWGQPVEVFCRNTQPAVVFSQDLEQNARVLVQRYEILYQNNRKGIEEIIRYLGLNLSNDEISNVLRLVTVHALDEGGNNLSLIQQIQHRTNKFIQAMPIRLKILPNKLGLSWLVRQLLLPREVQDSESLIHPDHISSRKGKPGEWRRHLTQQELAKVETYFGDWLMEHGYKNSKF